MRAYAFGKVNSDISSFSSNCNRASASEQVRSSKLCRIYVGSEISDVLSDVASSGVCATQRGSAHFSALLSLVRYS